MALTLTVLRDYAKDEVGTDLAALVSDADWNRYINEGIFRMEYGVEKAIAISWAADDTDFDLPADFSTPDKIEVYDGMQLPPGRFYGGKYYFTDPTGAFSSGSGTLFYYGDPGVLSSDGDISDLPRVADGGVVAFAVYRAYKRFGSSRSQYTRYSTVLQANGVQMEDLASMSDQYYAEFLEAKDNLRLRSPVTYHDD